MSITFADPKPWAVDSSCTGLDPDIFFPDPDDDAAAEPAQAVCADCPVREHCLDHALTHREVGVWGGATERERRSLIRSRRRYAA